MKKSDKTWSCCDKGKIKDLGVDISLNGQQLMFQCWS